MVVNLDSGIAYFRLSIVESGMNCYIALIVRSLKAGAHSMQVSEVLAFGTKNFAVSGKSNTEGATMKKALRGTEGLILKPGNFLLSHIVTYAVPSGLRGLTAVFGMGTGGSPSLRSPRSGLS